MSSAASDLCLQRAHAYLEDARDLSVPPSTRGEALDAARAALLDARRARAPPALLLPLFSALCAQAAEDLSPLARVVLPAAVDDLVSRDMPSFAAPATPFLRQALDDPAVPVVARALRALTALFRKVLGFAAAHNILPQHLLAVWLAMQKKAVALIAAPDDALRKPAIKFAETVVLAFSYSGGAASPDHFTLDYLVKKPPHSPLLAPNHLEQEGIQCINAIAHILTASLAGAVPTTDPRNPAAAPIPGLPPMSLMTAVSVLGNLVRRRRKLLEFTLPPFLSAVASVVTAARPAPEPPAFARLSHSQRASIIAVLRFNIAAWRAYQHTNVGLAGQDIAKAKADLDKLQLEEDIRRKDRAAELAAHLRIQQQQAADAAAAADIQKRRAAARIPPHPPHPHASLKRPRVGAAIAGDPIPVPDHAPPRMPWSRLPPKEAFALTQTIVQSMPPQEVVNFIMTRLLLNIPPADSIPGALQRPAQRGTRTTNREGNEEQPAVKRPRKSRFGSKEPEQRAHNDSTASPPPAKKVTVARKVAPPVVPVRLSASATERLITLCTGRMLKREVQAIASGAGPLRIQLLARLLTKLAQRDRGDVAKKFCDEVCAFVVDDVVHNMPLAQAWLHSLAIEAEMALLPPAKSPRMLSGGMGEAFRPLADQMLPADKEKNIKGEEVPAPDKKEEKAEVDVKIEPTTDTTPVSNAPCEGQSIDTKDTSPVPNGSYGAEGANGKAQNDISSDETVKEDEIPDSKTPEELEEDDLAPLVLNEAYNKIFAKLLKLLKDKQSSNAETLSTVVCDAPVIPPFVMETLKQYCLDPSRIKMGLHTLRDVVLKRPGEDRSKCLKMLLDFTLHEDEVLRGPSIRLVANKIFLECVGDVPVEIERRAVEALNASIGNLSEEPTTDEVNRVDRSSLLLTALCGQKHDLLQEIASSYINSPPAAKQVLLSRAKDLAAHLGISAGPVMQLISAKLPVLRVGSEKEDKPASDGLEELALEVLRAILKKFGRPTEDIVNAARLRYDLSGNTSFIIAILPGLRKEALVEYLGAIVTSVYSPPVTDGNGPAGTKNSTGEEASNANGFKEIIGIIMGSRPPALSAVDLLIELHNIKPSAAVSSAIRACFELKSVYKQDIIAQAIQQLMEKTVIPDLFMRTVHLAKIFYAELEKYLTGTVLKRLIDKHVWKNELLWEGFLRYCAEIQGKSFAVLVSLPAPQLADALKRQEGLVVVFKSLFANQKNLKKIQSVKHRKVILSAIQKPGKGT